MVIFSTAHEFEELLLHLSAKADTLRLQAKGGSMYPFVQSGDWVTVELCRGTCRVFERRYYSVQKDGSLYLHRVLSICRNGLLMKGDMSFGCDGAISPGDILARAISVERGRSIVNLNSRANRFIAVLAADLSLFCNIYSCLHKRPSCVPQQYSHVSRVLPHTAVLPGILLLRYCARELLFAVQKETI